MSKQTHLTVINLDRPRIMEMDLDTLAMPEELTGVKTFDDLKVVMQSFSGLKKAAYCALFRDAKDHGETLTLDNVGDVLRHAEYVNDIIEKVSEAVEGCFRPDEKEGAEQAAETEKN